MIEAHAFDSWTREASRHSIAWRNLVIVAGFAAPLFLWLAGVAAVLAATRAADRSGSRAKAAEAVCRRGAEIFILAFLFRVQAYVLSPGSPALTIFRVDILNIMGPSIVVVGVVWGLCRTSAQRAIVFSIVAAAICLLSPAVYATHAVDGLPAIAQWYVRHSGEYTTFALMPWVEFTFAGAAVGSLVAAARDESAEDVLHAALALAGAALVVIGVFASAQPRVFPGATFWTTSPTWFAIRIGIMMAMLAALARIDRPLTRVRCDGVRGRVWWSSPLARLGRSSLFVYWIHVELVYGYASYFWWKALPLWATGLAYAAFCAAMYGLVLLRDRAVAAWRARAQFVAPAVIEQT